MEYPGGSSLPSRFVQQIGLREPPFRKKIGTERFSQAAFIVVSRWPLPKLHFCDDNVFGHLFVDENRLFFFLTAELRLHYAMPNLKSSYALARRKVPSSRSELPIVLEELFYFCSSHLDVSFRIQSRFISINPAKLLME